MWSALLVAASASTALAGHLSAPLVRRKPNFERASELPRVFRRDGSIDLTAVNNITGGGYYSEFGIGTPPQTINFQLDTGSSDTWMNAIDSDLCSDDDAQFAIGYCTATFDYEASETFELIDRNGFDITYLDGRNIVGSYVADSVTIGDSTIDNQTLGLAFVSVRPTGIMGLGYSLNVAANRPYPTIVDNLVSAGVISSPLFSLYLNDLSEDGGSILFGAIDSEKYMGNLAILPIIPDTFSGSQNITSYTVALDGITVNGDAADDIPSFQGEAILDSGSTISLLPDSIASAIQEMFEVVLVDEFPVPLADCAWAGERGDGISISFEFDGKTIDVPADELLIDAFPEAFQDFLAEELNIGGDWDGLCMFGIESSLAYGVDVDDWALLGDTMLRSAYVVYDMANHEIGIAQANPGSTNSNIIEIAAEGDSIPDEEGVSAPNDDDNSDDSDDSSDGGSGDDSDDGDNGGSGDDSGDTGGSGEDTTDDGGDNEGAGSQLTVSFTLLVLIGAFATSL